MANIRLIPRLDIRGDKLIERGHCQEGKVIGPVRDFALKYYKAGADELLYMDVDASVDGHDHLSEVMRQTVEDVFIPITVGGGVSSIGDVRELLRSGADKVAINRAAVEQPELIHQISRRFGRQCLVLSVEAKKIDEGRWEAYTDNGGEATGLDVVEWCKRSVELGVGEILLTSMDQQGTGEGFDTELIQLVSCAVSVPVIASGGMGAVKDLLDAVRCGADAIGMANVLHFDGLVFDDIRQGALDNDLHVRRL